MQRSFWRSLLERSSQITSRNDLHAQLSSLVKNRTTLLDKMENASAITEKLGSKLVLDTKQLYISPIKREKMRKQHHLNNRLVLRAKLPVLTREEIRRYRMPTDEAVLIELTEGGLHSAAIFIKQLIEYQDYICEFHGQESLTWSKPRLKHSPEVLTQIGNALKKAEKAHYDGDIATECDQFLELSANFAFDDSQDWWWLAEQLLLQCTYICAGYDGDGGRRNATCKYIFGKFLLENMNDRELAQEHLRRARRLSNGHSWTAAKLLRRPQKTIFVESCILLYTALLDEAKDLLQENPRLACKLCIRARRRAYDACDREGEAKAMIAQGECELRMGEITAACQTFYKVLVMRLKAKKIEETCEARIALLSSYLKLGNWQEAYVQLQELLKFAETYNLPYYVGQSYRYLGEYYLMHGNPNLATPLLLKALNAFHEIGDVNNREHTKNFAAVSAGQEMMPMYIEFILKCGEPGAKGYNYVMKLVKWKDSRDISWSESTEKLSSDFSKDELVEGAEIAKLLREHELLATGDHEESGALIEETVPPDILSHSNEFNHSERVTTIEWNETAENFENTQEEI